MVLSRQNFLKLTAFIIWYNNHHKILTNGLATLYRNDVTGMADSEDPEATQLARVYMSGT